MHKQLQVAVACLALLQIGWICAANEENGFKTVEPKLTQDNFEKFDNKERHNWEDNMVHKITNKRDAEITENSNDHMDQKDKTSDLTAIKSIAKSTTVNSKVVVSTKRNKQQLVMTEEQRRELMLKRAEAEDEQERQQLRRALLASIKRRQKIENKSEEKPVQTSKPKEKPEDQQERKSASTQINKQRLTSTISPIERTPKTENKSEEKTVRLRAPEEPEDQQEHTSTSGQLIDTKTASIDQRIRISEKSLSNEKLVSDATNQQEKLRTTTNKNIKEKSLSSKKIEPIEIKKNKKTVIESQSENTEDVSNKQELDRAVVTKKIIVNHKSTDPKPLKPIVKSEKQSIKNIKITSNKVVSKSRPKEEIELEEAVKDNAIDSKSFSLQQIKQTNKKLMLNNSKVDLKTIQKPSSFADDKHKHPSFAFKNKIVKNEQDN